MQSGIVLQVAGNPNLEVALKVGSVSEQVEVQADANFVETRSAEVGTVMENQRLSLHMDPPSCEPAASSKGIVKLRSPVRSGNMSLT